MNTEHIISVFSICIALSAFLVSYLGLNESKKRNRGSVLLGCLDKYIAISHLKEQALQNRDKLSAKRFYEAKFDLLWSEYRIWNAGLIPEDVMIIWANSLHEGFKNGEISFESNGNLIQITLREVWDELRDNNHFHPQDSFVTFIELIRQGQIQNALLLRFNPVYKLIKRITIKTNTMR